MYVFIIFICVVQESCIIFSSQPYFYRMKILPKMQMWIAPRGQWFWLPRVRGWPPVPKTRPGALHKSGVDPLWVCDDLSVRADSHCWLPSTRLSSHCCRVRPSRTQTCRGSWSSLQSSRLASTSLSSASQCPLKTSATSSYWCGSWEQSGSIMDTWQRHRGHSSVWLALSRQTPRTTVITKWKILP